MALREKRKCDFSFVQDTQGIYIDAFSRTIIWVLQSQRIEVFRVEDLATSFCGEVVFVPRCIIVFSQFIVNSGFGYNFSVVISILL